MEPSTLNWFAIVVAALLPYPLGFLWFGPLFGKPWMAASGMTEEKARQANPAKLFGGAGILQFVMAWCLAMFLNSQEIGLAQGAFYGFLAGAGWILPAFAVSGFFEQKSGSWILLNGVYWTVALTAMGALLGGWR